MRLLRWVVRARSAGAVLGLGALAIVLCGFVGARAYAAWTAYAAATRDIDDLRTLAQLDASSVSSMNLSRAQATLDDLRTQLVQLDRATSLPIGQSKFAAVPWLGSRYAAGRDLVHIGLMSVDAATELTRLGQDVLPRLEAAMNGQQATDTASWLDLMASNKPQLVKVTSDLRAIKVLRSRVQDDFLPAAVRAKVAELDRVLGSPPVQALTELDFDATWAALGGSAPARYLLVFQNPAELRPTGGFPGTMALVSIDHGRLSSYNFFDAHELSNAYMAQRSMPLAQPWPIEQYFPQDGFQLHDALWWPDFPRSAQQLMAMYAETGWPPIEGVVALQPEVAAQLVEITGPMTVDLDGRTTRITADNVYEQINARRGTREGFADATVVHKELLRLVGENLIHRLMNANPQVLARAVRDLAADCANRNVQVYTVTPSIEAALDVQHCTGRLLPVDGEPTLAVTYANLALSKTSVDMRPALHLTLQPPSDGHRLATLDIDLRDGARADEDPIYSGFQRWWVEVQLPEGSTLLTDPGPEQDPEAPNGGSYLADLFPDKTGRITVQFDMPDSPSLLVRRQPGVSIGDLTVSKAGCQDDPVTQELSSDVVLDLTSICAGH
jgi:hypothetical protein